MRNPSLSTLDAQSGLVFSPPVTVRMHMACIRDCGNGLSLAWVLTIIASGLAAVAQPPSPAATAKMVTADRIVRACLAFISVLSVSIRAVFLVGQIRQPLVPVDEGAA